MKHRIIIEFETDTEGTKPSESDELIVAAIVDRANFEVGHKVQAAHYINHGDYVLWAEPPREMGQIETKED
jgi:hypothetical protein